MAKDIRSNNVGSLVLDSPSGAGNGHFKIWSAFSGAYFRRMILETMVCGGCKQYSDEQVQDHPKLKMGVRSLRSELSREDDPEKLSELLRLPEEEEDELMVKKKIEGLEELKKVVKRLQNDEVLEGAKEVRRLTKDDSEARTTLGLLGAIPPLVALLDAQENIPSQIAALYALLNLSIANEGNKAAIVKAGAIHKMLKLIQSRNGLLDPSVSEAIVANFLGLSALDSNKPIIGSSGAIPFLVKTFQEFNDTSSSREKEDVLRALYNLSISSTNVLRILETDLIKYLMSKLGDMDVSERILAILSNIVSVPEGRKAIINVCEGFTILVDVLSWTDSPVCQEKASYILMVMAHKGYGERQAMIEAGIVSSLLELTLLGSTLTQKRASRILEFLRVDKGKQVSEPLCGQWSSSSDPSHQWKSCQEDENGMASEERRAVEQLVQQSLENNMKRIAKRANLNHDFVHSNHYKSLTLSSTSKSLPF